MLSPLCLLSLRFVLYLCGEWLGSHPGPVCSDLIVYHRATLMSLPLGKSPVLLLFPFLPSFFFPSLPFFPFLPFLSSSLAFSFVFKTIAQHDPDLTILLSQSPRDCLFQFSIPTHHLLWPPLLPPFHSATQPLLPSTMDPLPFSRL